ELVIGIVVFTISLTVVLSLIVPQAEQTAEPFRQVKAAKLGQSLMND
ncbi:MAG TPA: agglutinin biogenesis protein MshD, partial [Alteromonas macleodii]|nr:agglutinin biogenesis protein MshD [Alteromonas macleodii]